MSIKLSPHTADEGFCSLHTLLSSQASYKPLLKQVVEDIFNPEKPDPVDIEHMSSGLTDLLKTGFSMFMKVRGQEGAILNITCSFAEQRRAAHLSPAQCQGHGGLPARQSL